MFVDGTCKFLFQQATLIVQLPPRLTVLEAVAFRQEFAQKLTASPELRKVVLDFGQTTVIDSSGIGALVSNIKLTRAQNLTLVAWSVNAQLKLALSLSGLDQILAIEDHTEAILPDLDCQFKQRSPVTHPSVRSPLKRTVDILGAVVGLGLTSLIFIPIAVAIKLDSPGPSCLAKSVVAGWANGFESGNFAQW
jgi:anti-anti-sigma factor